MNVKDLPFATPEERRACETIVMMPLRARMPLHSAKGRHSLYFLRGVDVVERSHGFFGPALVVGTIIAAAEGPRLAVLSTFSHC